LKYIVLLVESTTYPCSHLSTFFGDIILADKNLCWRPVNQNTLSGRLLGEWARLTL